MDVRAIMESEAVANAHYEVKKWVASWPPATWKDVMRMWDAALRYRGIGS